MAGRLPDIATAALSQMTALPGCRRLGRVLRLPSLNGGPDMNTNTNTTTILGCARSIARNCYSAPA